MKTSALRRLVTLAGTMAALLSSVGCVRGFQSMDLSSQNIFSSISSPEVFQNYKALYEANCAACHGGLESSTKRDRSAAQISSAIQSQATMSHLAKSLSPDDIQKIAAVLSTTATALGPGGLPASCNANTPEFVNVQRLNNLEYNNVIRDLTGLDLKPADAFPKDARGQVFSNTALALGVDLTLGQMYFDSSMTTLDRAFSQARSNIVTCDPNVSPGHRACAEKVIREFGLKAFRRPLTSTELTQLLARYEATRTIFPAGVSASQFDESLKASLQMILVSPSFLYRIVEPPVDGSGARDLSPYELASRLSFFIWGSIPDSTLFAAAANNSILNPAVLSAQVDRMLKDPKSIHMVDAFAIQWLGLDNLSKTIKNQTVYPDFTESLRAAMLTESRMLLADIIQKDQSPYLLLNANYTYVNSELGRHYGLTGPATGFARVDLSSTSRRGIFSHASLLSVNSIETESSIIKRGLYFLKTFMCMNPGAPPVIGAGDAPSEESLEGLNPRERLEAHVSNPKCSSCHQQIDPPGFALENFDGIGKYRTQYSDGDQVDSRGEFADGQPMSSPADMAALLTNSDRFKSCFSRNLMTFALGRDLLETDKCAADRVASLTVSRDKKFSDIVKQIVLSPQFLKQKGG